MMVTAVWHNIGDLTAYLDAGVADMAELRRPTWRGGLATHQRPVSRARGS